MKIRYGLLAWLLGLLAFAAPVAAQTRPVVTRPVVVELFTSQGCSSCPPADANLIQLMNRSDVLALSFGITYWNDLGWKDTFAQAAFTERQFAYEKRLGHESAFTPQIVIDGAHDTVGHDAAEIESLIAQATARQETVPKIELAFDPATERLILSSTPAEIEASDVWLVAYTPDVAEVPVARGENRRRVLRIGHPVQSLTRLGSWSGDEARFTLPLAQAGTARAILIQAGPGGPILTARKL